MPYDDYSLLEITFDGHVAVVAMNQPERLNPTGHSLIQVRDAFMELEIDPEVHVVVLTGKGRAFSAGADQGGPNAPPPDPRLATMAGRGSQAGHFLYGAIPGGPGIADGSAFLYLRNFRKPLIGAVHGYALGGGWEVAQTCDIIIAAESTRFGALEIRHGLYPFGVGSQHLAKTVGRHKAAYLMMTGEMIDAQTAYEWNLVSKVVPDDELMDTAMEVAHKVAGHAPLALGLAKYMVNKALNIEEHYDLERALAYHLGSTEDTQAAREAYRKQEPTPEWQMK